MQHQRLVQKKTSDEVEKKGDFCIVNMGTFKDEKKVRTVVTKCPFCPVPMYMATTAIHQIHESGKIASFLSKLGLPVGITITPHMECPYNKNHKFSFKRGSLILIK